MKGAILIVDYDISLLSALEFNLVQSGYRVLRAMDGKDALDIALKEHPDIILSEVAIPGMDGIGLCKRIREYPNLKDVLFIFLTTHRKPEERVAGLRAGADDYITKPFDIDELIARIEVIHRRAKGDLHKDENLIGTFSSIPLPDVLQILEQSRKKGKLIIQTEDEEGFISFSQGLLIDAVYGNLRGEDALVRMFPLREGRFRYEEVDVASGSIKKSIGFTMIEIARLCDEIEMLKDLIPENNIRFRLVKQPPEPDHETSIIIRLLNESPRDINELISLSGLSMTRVSIAIARLRKDSLIEVVKDNSMDNMNSRKDPIRYALWGMLDGNIESMGIQPALRGGMAIAKSLEGNTVIERLSEIDGNDNYEFQSKNGFKLVIIRRCPFESIYKDIPPWSESTMRLIDIYNKIADGGGVLHPFCLVHIGIRNAISREIISIGCRDSLTGKIEIAEGNIKKIGLSKEEAIGMLEGKACLFAIKEEIN